MSSIELDHVVLEVEDPRAAARFLHEVLGLPPVRMEEFEAGTAPFPSVRVSEGTVIDLFPRRLWAGEAPRNPNHLCFTVAREQFEALRARLAAMRIAITRTSEHNFGARGYGHSIYFDGPDALNLEVRYYDEQPLARVCSGRESA